jgi:hypothetical protein
MHAGVLPGYPASHGCIRMPPAFAVKLYGLTRLGARVIVARGDVKPVPFEDAHLFTKLKPAEDKAALLAPPAEHAPLVRTAESQNPVVSDAIAAPKDASNAAAEKAGEGATGTVVTVTPVPVVPAQPIETHSTFVAPTPNQTAAPLTPPVATAAAPTAAAAPAAPAAPATANAAPAAEATQQASLEQFGPERPLRPGPITVFVSKKEGKVFIRKGFQPIFSAPATIAEPARPLGTHIYTAVDAKADGVNFDWQVVSLPATEAAKKAEVKVERDRHGRRIEKAAPAAASMPTSTAAEALARIELPPAAQWRISSLMSAGAALIISDQGLGGETGTETDFIVLTR